MELYGYDPCIWSRGTIATEPEIDYEGMPLFLIDSRTRPGQSGSPVLLYSAGGMVPMQDGSSAMFGGAVTRLIGIYSGRVNSESDLGKAWKVNAIQDVVEGLRRSQMVNSRWLDQQVARRSAVAVPTSRLTWPTQVSQA